MADYNAMAIKERETLFGDLQNLTEQDWATMTVCDPWTVRHLTAHLAGLGHQTPFGFFTGLVKNGFSFSKFMAAHLEKFNQGTNADVLANFEQTMSKMKPPPGPKYVALGEYMVHGEDIRRSIGQKGTHPEEHMVALAEEYKKTGNPLNGKTRFQGLSFNATDADWKSGDGPEVSGPAMDLIMAIAGRGAALDACTGEGVATLKSRC